MEVDTDGNVYVTDYNNRIQKFSSDGTFIEKWGTKGSGAGQLYWPEALAIKGNDTLYVADTYNHRIQVFKKVLESFNQSHHCGRRRAGGREQPLGCHPVAPTLPTGRLTYRGFPSTSYYLCANTTLDLDGDGVSDVDADATNSSLQDAITTLANSGDTIGDVVLYLVDHGGSGQFRMSGSETLSAGELATWLDALKGSITGRRSSWSG